MKILIETYRGIEIYFDTENETFICSLTEDSGKQSKSFSAVKKAVDEYKKDNASFKPFKVRGGQNSYRKEVRYTITGIRKDGAFVGTDTKGQTVQISKYDERDLVLDDPENEIHYATIASLEMQVDAAKEKVEKYRKTVKETSLISVKSNYLVNL